MDSVKLVSGCILNYKAVSEINKYNYEWFTKGRSSLV